ncbi:MAG: AMP-binding enzyme, partial [Acidovorax sp.]|uniref:AMP-binding enzyme n=1 Tax=Acidovorax sp. TaxID=1872122 RepID=UPI00391AD612
RVLPSNPWPRFGPELRLIRFCTSKPPTRSGIGLRSKIVRIGIVGLDHPDLGSELVAVIEPNAGAIDRAALARHLDIHLPRYKHPRRIWLCRALPMTQSGKVAAGTLKQWIVDGHDALEPFV